MYSVILYSVLLYCRDSVCFVVLATLGCNTSGFESSCKGLTHSGVVLGYLRGLGFRGLGV